MAKTDYTVQVTLEAVNHLTSELESVKKQVGDLEKTAQASAKSVEKTAESTFSKLKSGLASLGIAAAIYKVGQSIRDLTTAIEPIENSFYRLSESAGIAGDKMLQAMREATLGTVSDYNLMQEANTAYSLGIVSNIEDMTTMMEIARLKGQAMGRSMEEALDDIVRGLGRGSTMILDNLGIVIKQSEAQELYAQQLGKTVDQLTEAEKKQALVNAVVEQGKKELEATGEVAFTTQERIAQIQTAFQNLATEIGKTAMPWVTYFFNEAKKMAEDLKNSINLDTTSVVNVIGGGLAVILKILQSLGTLLGDFFAGLWISISNQFNDAINKFIRGINGLIKGVNSVLGTEIGLISERYTSEAYTMRSIMSNSISDVKDIWNDFIDDYMKTSKEAENSTKKTANTIKDLGGAMGGGVSSGGSGSSSTKKDTEALKQLKKQYDSINDSVDEQYKKIIDLNKERQSGFDELQDNLDDVDKNIKNLKEDVSGLRGELSKLGKEETSDIATEFVNARKELQKMERDYAGIGEVASKYSLDYLENYQHGGIGKYDIEALIQYKKYSDEMASVYEGMNAQERQAMDEQIAYQEWYQSLNGIEKIKEDYRIKREEIQSELNEKMSALRSEEIKRAEIDKQMKQYQKEWLAAIDVEVEKWKAMYKEKMEYERQYMEQLEIDTNKQLEMYNQLIAKARELAKVRADTGGPTGTRASGGPVYQGQSYLVGENGPELFIPSQNGKITRNEDLGKGQEFTININMGGVVVNDSQDTSDMANEIAETITRQLELYKKGIY